MLNICLHLALLVQLPQTPAARPPQDPPYFRVITHGGHGLVDRLTKRGFDAQSHPPVGMGLEAAEVILDERRLPVLYRVVGRSNVMVMERSRPLSEIMAQLKKAAGLDLPPDARYKTPAEIVTELGKLQTAYPKLALRIDLNARYRVGLTHEGRRIYALKISDNPTKDEDEPAMLLVTNHHAREINTIEATLYAAGQLLSRYATDPKIKKLVDENEIWLVPTMNPDGLNYVWTTNNMWRKNRRNNGGGVYGVDQNRNYPYFWSRCGSSTNPGSSTYHGPSAGSEPETKVMLALGNAEVFERMLDFHSYSRDVRYGYNRLTGRRLPSGLKSYLDKLQGQVATAMNYRWNSSCCCGGDQHWHFAENGSLAYLAEMDTAFQPAWSQTQLEIVRVWGGVRFFFEIPVPLRGHVLSLAGAKPLAATVEVVGQPLLDGQKRRSSPRHGRYAAWLPTGTYNLRIEAPGHVARTIQVSVTEGKTVDLDVRLVPVMKPTVLTTRGTPKLGTSVFLDLSSPDDPGRDYIIAAALGNTPPIPVGPRSVPLADDSLLHSFFTMTSVFVNAFGKLSASGQGTMTFAIPKIPVLAGLKVYFCGVTLDTTWPSDVKGISNGLRLTLQ